MSDKMECPGCQAVSSSVLISAERGEPCPFCGLSASAIYEISGVRRKQADQDLKERLEKALIERDRTLAEIKALRNAVSGARRALGCDYPYAPHDAIKPEDRGAAGG